MRDVAVSPTLTLGQRIKAARKQAKFSHDRLAAAVGTSRQHLIKLEKDMHRPRPEMLARIAEATREPSLVVTADEDEEDPAMREAFSLFVDLMDWIAARRAEREGEVRA